MSAVLEYDCVNVGVPRAAGHEDDRLYAVGVLEYTRSLLARGMMRQLHVDLPRVQCTINGARVRTVGQFRAAVARVYESHLHAMLPFAAQSSLSLPLELLQATLGGCTVVDGKLPMRVEFHAAPHVWSVNITKQMRVFESGARFDLRVAYESLCDSVLVFWTAVGDEAL